MSQTFNTVLIPPVHIADEAIKFSQHNFAHDHMGYCLGSDGHLAHITLAQSTVPNKETLHGLYGLLSQLKWDGDLLIELDDYYHDIERGYCGVSIKSSTSLQKIHDTVIKTHKEFDLEIHGAIGKDYWPHFTLAKTKHQISEPVNLPSALQGQSNGWTIEFGHMGEHGVYLGKYTS